MTLLEYRIDTFGYLIGDILWMSFTVVFFKILYLNISDVAGWDFNGLLLILTAYYISDAIAWLFYAYSFRESSTSIQDGSLDYVLIKPVDSQFYLSFRWINMANFSAIATSIFIILFVFGSGIITSIFSLLLFFFFTFIGILIHYSLTVLLSLTGFLFIRNNSLWGLDYAFRDFGKMPVDIYPKPLKIFLSFVIPVGIMTTFPARAFLGNLPWEQMLLAISMAIIFFIVSRLLWNLAVSHYQSASS